jgi:hypothetical protein
MDIRIMHLLLPNSSPRSNPSKKPIKFVPSSRNTLLIQQKSPVWINLASALDRSRTSFIREPLRIAVVGDAGEGKSNPIGTLLGDTGITIDVSDPSLASSITLAKVLLRGNRDRAAQG